MELKLVNCPEKQEHKNIKAHLYLSILLCLKTIPKQILVFKKLCVI